MDTEKNEYIKRVLTDILTDPIVPRKGLKVSIITSIARDKGIKKSELKEARKELGIISHSMSGIWYWILPETDQC